MFEACQCFHWLPLGVFQPPAVRPYPSRLTVPYPFLLMLLDGLSQDCHCNTSIVLTAAVASKTNRLAGQGRISRVSPKTMLAEKELLVSVSRNHPRNTTVSCV